MGWENGGEGLSFIGENGGRANLSFEVAGNF